ncbi:MAG TPA: c-type cytochrome [Sulfurovum sp.]|nr:c-type cytochrome [Sulfurovum sp.]
MKKTLLLLATTTAITLASTGAELLEKKCASCHMLEAPTFHQIPTLKAPPLDSIVFHVNLAIEDEQKKKEFIVDYVLNPDVSKTVCESNKVAKYGVMPSQKGNVSKEELALIAAEMLAKYPHPQFVSMIKEMLTNDKMKALQTSPFLVNSEGLPHMTKLLVQNWDKAGLGLTKEQKEKLLLVRKETLGEVKAIKQQLAPLEAVIAEAMIDREDPKSVEKQLEKIAKLKIEASKAHLKCIAKTTAILSDEQVAFLLPFWE